MKKLFLITCIAAFLVSCQTQSKLNLSEAWKLTELNGKDITKINAELTLNFDTAKMEVNGSGGCNRYFGGYKLVNNELEIGALGATKMYCEETNKLEDEYFQTFQGKLQLKSTENRLEMKKDGKMVLVFVKK